MNYYEPWKSFFIFITVHSRSQQTMQRGCRFTSQLWSLDISQLPDHLSSSGEGSPFLSPPPTSCSLQFSCGEETSRSRISVIFRNCIMCNSIPFHGIHSPTASSDLNRLEQVFYRVFLLHLQLPYFPPLIRQSVFVVSCKFNSIQF